MKDLNIIYGDGEDTKRKLDTLLEPAVKFYGSVYENLIFEVVKNTGFYESDGKYSEKEIIEYIAGNKKIRTSKFLGKVASFYYRIGTPNGKAVGVVATPKVKTDYDYHIFAHELFGHAMCDRYNPIVEIDGKSYKRNGISLTKCRKDYYDLLNEGFMEVIASSIVAQNSKGIQEISSLNYLTAKYSASKIFDTIGKEKMLKVLTYYKHNIEKIYNENSKINELAILDRLLRLELKTREKPTINRVINTKIEENLGGFQKRKIRK